MQTQSMRQSDLVVGLFGFSAVQHALAVEASVGLQTERYFKTITTATEGNSAAALTMDTSVHIYEIVWNGENLKGYVDGELVATFTDDIPTAVLTPSIAFRTGSTAAKTCTIHWAPLALYGNGEYGTKRTPGFAVSSMGSAK